MRKAVIAAVAAALALAPVPVLAAPSEAHASPQCPGPTPTPAMEACYCAKLVGAPNNGYQMCLQGEHQTLEQEMRLPCPDNKRRILDPPYCVGDASRTPATTPAQAPAPKPAAVRPPNAVGAPPQAIAAAKAAPPTQVDPANPPQPPSHVDFNQRVQKLISTHSPNIDFVNGLAHPRHWEYIDYDQNRRPVLYNPLNQAMTFRYFYAGAYRELYVAAGTSVALNVTVDGVFPFTAVGDDYLTTGSFYAGSRPPVYQHVAAHLPAQNQTVQVGSVQVVGHDASQPVGNQDTFMLDDSTLAWGQATNPSDGGQITVNRTQTLPGVGPMDDGRALIDLSEPVHQQAADNTRWLWPLAGGLLVLAAGLVTLMVLRRRRNADA
jgi:hypothetical protein